MSTCTNSAALLEPSPNKGRIYSHRIDSKGDLQSPTIVVKPAQKPKHLHEADDNWNRYALTERESHGKRTSIRMGFESYARSGAKQLGFMRLRNRHMLMSFPSAEQAELAIETILRVVAGLDGKLLARAPEEK